MHVTVGKFLLVRIYFVQFRSHLGVSVPPADLTTKDVAALGGSSWLSVAVCPADGVGPCVWAASRVDL